jgi:hypothetical protein
MPIRGALAVVLAGILGIAACDARVPPTPSTEPPPPSLAGGCPPFAFDARAVLGPEFSADIFPGAESSTITADFLRTLSALYAGRDRVDPCRWLTARGWERALEADRRLRDATHDEKTIDGRLVLRVAFEGAHDLRVRPPTVPIDAVFDILPGATETDRATGGTTTTTALERIGLHLELRFDGHHWRVDDVGPISPEYAEDATLPAPVPPGPPCAEFRRDAPGAPFDDASGVMHGFMPTDPAPRPWCDADGRGHVIRQPEQLQLLTGYPCSRGAAAILSIGRPLGSALDRLVPYEYVRDPGGLFLAEHWITVAWDGEARLPADAASTGWTNGNIELWTSESASDAAVFIVRGGTVERWPRVIREWGFVDCN